MNPIANRFLRQSSNLFRVKPQNFNDLSIQTKTNSSTISMILVEAYNNVYREYSLYCNSPHPIQTSHSNKVLRRYFSLISIERNKSQLDLEGLKDLEDELPDIEQAEKRRVVDSPITSLYQDIKKKFHNDDTTRTDLEIVTEIENLSEKLRNDSVSDGEKVDIHIRLAQCYREMYSFKEATKIIQKALKLSKDVFGPISVETAKVYRIQRSLLMEQLKWKDAAKCQEVIIQIETSLLGDQNDISILIQEWDELGEIYRKVGEFEYALQAYNKGLELMEQHEGPLYLKLQQHLAHLHYNKGDYMLTIDILTKIASHSENDSTMNFDLYHTLGNAYLYEGEHKKAEESYLHALKFSDDEIQKASMYYSLGVLHQTLKNHIKAKRYTKEAIRIFEPFIQHYSQLPTEMISLDHYATLNKASKAYLTLGAIYFQTSEEDESEKMFLKALDLQHRSSQNNNHADMAYIYDHLGQLADKKGEKGEAHSLFRKALVLAQQISSPNNYQLASVLMHLGSYHFNQENIQDAVYHLEQSFETYKRCYPGGTCVEMGDVLALLAKCWESVDNWKNCKLCAEEARNIYVHHSSNVFDDKIDEMIELRKKAYKNLYDERHLQSIKKESSKDFTKEERGRLGQKYAKDSKRDILSKAQEDLIDKKRKAIDPTYVSYFEREEIERKGETIDKLKEKSESLKGIKLVSQNRKTKRV